MLRIADEHDKDFAYQLRNLPTTFKNCGRARTLTKEEFLKTLTKNTVLFIIEDFPIMTAISCSSPDRIGYIRFDKDGKDCEVGIALLPRFWGKGYGHSAIREGIRIMRIMRKDVILFKATIRKDNIPSQRIFEINRFQKTDEDEDFFYYKAV